MLLEGISQAQQLCKHMWRLLRVCWQIQNCVTCVFLYGCVWTRKFGINIDVECRRFKWKKPWWSSSRIEPSHGGYLNCHWSKKWHALIGNSVLDRFGSFGQMLGSQALRGYARGRRADSELLSMLKSVSGFKIFLQKGPHRTTIVDSANMATISLTHSLTFLPLYLTYLYSRAAHGPRKFAKW